MPSITRTERRRWSVAIALCVVLALKLFVLSELVDHPLLQHDAGLDTSAYVDLARRVLSGDLGLGPGLYYVSPLYIYFLAVAYGVTQSFAGVQVIQVMLGTATVWLVFVMGRSWAGERAAWIGAALAAGCGVLTFHEIILMQSALDPFLTACALASLTLALRRSDAATSKASDARWFVLTGVCFGLLSLNRPQALVPAAVVVLLLAVLRRMKPAALTGAGLLIAMLPVAARNVVVAGQWSLVSSHGGLNFFIGNHPHATGLYTLIPGIRPGIEGQEEDTRKVAEAATGRTLSDAEVSDYFFDRGWEWIRTNPAAAGRLFVKKLVLAVHADHVALPHSYEFFADDERTALRWLALNPWLIMPLGLAGLLFVRPRNSRETPAGFWVWASFVPAYAVALAVFFLAERYRLPMLVPASVLAGLFVDWVLRVMTGEQRPWRLEVVAAAIGLALTAIVVNWPFELADNREGDRLRMVQHAAKRNDVATAERWAGTLIGSSNASANVEERIGRIYLAAGHHREAVRYLMKAVDKGGATHELRVDLADAQRQHGDPSGSMATLQSIDWNGAGAPTVLRAGRLAAAVGQGDLSVSLFTRATEIDPTSADAWAQLGLGQLIAGRTLESEQALLKAVQWNTSDAAVFGGLAVCAARLGRIDEARARANAALKIDPSEPLARQVLAALAGR